MSRRRRRVKIKSSSRLFVFILFNLLLLANCIMAHYQQAQSPRHSQAGEQAKSNLQLLGSSARPTQLKTSILFSSQQQQEQLNSEVGPPGALGNEELEAEEPQVLASYHQHSSSQDSSSAPHQRHQHIPSVASLCNSLPSGQARHLKLCKLVHRSPAADEAVAMGAGRGLAECRTQFKSERWNCTHASGDHHLLTGKLAQSVGNREGAFVQAIAAAGIVHSVATACSQGTLSDCACDKTRVGLIRQEEGGNWKWGGCSNNIRYGMTFARHLVELLDAVHEHEHHQRQLGPERPHARRRRRSLSARGQRENQVRSSSATAAAAESRQQVADAEVWATFCQRNAANISQATQVQLIKSMLAKNGLERHQDFRLAVNAHNNRVGRMAVARNMELKCRCHGLSGSCSLKTCWLRLPDFQQIGAYLRRKYEASVHLPTAINVNKLIPLMDRQEMSAILLQQQVQTSTISSPPVPSAAPAPVAESDGPPAPEFAALSAAKAVAGVPNVTTAITPPPHFNYYERHRQLERLTALSGGLAGGANVATPCGNQSAVTCLYMHGDETPIQIAPMSNQQYATLLRDMKLCSNSRALGMPPGPHAPAPYLAAPTSKAAPSHLSTRDTKASTPRKSQQQQQSHNAEVASNQRQHHIGSLLHQSNREDLVHLHKSPDYCEADLRHGFAGVQARACSADPLAHNSCDKLCCGRGHARREYELRFNCDCKFQYCCKIHCNVCHRKVVEFECK